MSKYSSNRYSIPLESSNLLVDIKYVIIEFSIGLFYKILNLQAFFSGWEDGVYTPPRGYICSTQ